MNTALNDAAFGLISHTFVVRVHMPRVTVDQQRLGAAAQNPNQPREVGGNLEARRFCRTEARNTDKLFKLLSQG